MSNNNINNRQVKITKTQKAVLNKEAHQPTKHKNNNIAHPAGCKMLKW